VLLLEDRNCATWNQKQKPMTEQRGLLREGFERVWNYQRVLWWMFFVNFALAFLGATPALDRMHHVLDHSMQSRRLVETFDYGAFSALTSDPEIDLYAPHGASIHFALVFFIFVLFLTGGILEAYRSGRKLTAREFFEACGSYFWRWVRLLIFMLIVLVPVGVLASLVSKGTGKLLGDAGEMVGYGFMFAGIAVVALLASIVRLWFDMAQVRAVVEEETGMWRNALRAFTITTGNFGTLLWMSLRLSLLGWLIFVVGVYVWTKMPPGRFEWTVLFLEIVIVLNFGTRLWQRACEMVWYQRQFVVPVAVSAPVPMAPPPSTLVTIAPPEFPAS
jgi:hypothetical protein